MIIDPGDEAERILAVVNKRRWNVQMLVHTHAHLDHMMATGEVQAETHARILLHEADRWLYENLDEQCVPFQISVKQPPAIDDWLSDGDSVTFGECSVNVIHTPGHSPGGCCLQCTDGDRRIFSGDVLFRGSIGRTDLWHGSETMLLQSIQARLLTLDDAIPVYPGHGAPTTIGEERENNLFLTPYLH